MTLHRNGFEGQTPGGAATVVNSSISGDAWTSQALNGGSAVYSTSQAASGSQSLLITTDGTNAAYFDDNSFNSTSIAVSDCFYYSGPPTGTSPAILQVRTASGAAAVVILLTNGKLQMQDSTGSNVGTMTTTMSSGHWYRIELQVFSDASNGTLAMQYYIDNSSAVIQSLSASSLNTLGGAITLVRRGCTASTYTNALPYWNYDNIQAQDGTTAPIGAYVAPPLTILRNSAEGQPDGTTLTAANSGGGSGTAFSIVAGASVTVTYSAEQAMHGSQSYKIVTTSGGSSTLVYSVTGDITGAHQMYIYLTAYPSANNLCMSQLNASSGLVTGISISSTGKVVITDSTHTTVTSSPNGTIPLNTWVRLDLCTTLGGTSSTGRIQATASLGDSTSAIWSYDSGYAASAGTAAIASYRFGKLDSVPTIATFYLDGLGYASGATVLLPPAYNPASIAWFNPYAGGAPFMFEDFENGSNGAAISTSNTGLSTILGTGTAVFDNTLSASGAQSAKVTSTGVAGNYCQLTVNFGPDQSNVYLRFAVFIAGFPASNLYIAGVSNHGGLTNVRINTAGTITLTDNGIAVATSTNTVPVNTWFQLEWNVSNTAGTQTLKLYTDAAGTLLETISGTYAQGTMPALSIGIVATNNNAIWLDALGVSFANWVGPL